MKQQLLFVGALLFVGLSISAQQKAPFISNDIPQVPVEARIAVPMPQYTIDGFNEVPKNPLNTQINENFEHVQLRELVIERQIIGLTQYDLQSNAAIDDRMAGSGDAVSAAWIMSLEITPFNDRGTGYNHFASELWGEQPYERIESERAGWPSIFYTGSGEEVVISHAGIDTPLLMAKRTIGSGSWEESYISSDGPFGNLWPRAAVGGPDGNTIHVICVSTPIGNGGTEFQGQDGALLYYRSLDAGETWEMHTFAELDSTQFNGFAGDTYAIHARNGVVAFTVFNDLMDTFVMQSDDNGDNWEYTAVADFPIDNYVIDSGLPDSLGYDFNDDGIFQEYLNSDGAGDIHVDQFGQVHMVFGAMYYMDADTTDDNFSYFPGTNGLQYWNDSYGVDSSLTIAYAYDLDESGGIDLEDEIAAYYVNLAGIPSMASNEDGDLFVSYSAINEMYTTGVQNYRHIYLVHSTDNGLTWNSDDACNLTPDLDYDGYESVFGSISPDVDEHLEIIYQRDFEPGLHVRGDEDPVDLNDIVHIRVPTSDLADCADIEFVDWVGIDEPFDEGDVTLYPNPSTSTVQLIIDRPGVHNVKLYDLGGRILLNFETSAMVQDMNISDFSSGVYLVEVAQGNASTVIRLAID
ncbi:MAG: hypothetical protein CL847_07105 [Crocinitomicaceae bacterium]|nr:hypothetical protein [Crocinitomicaceae bacterium]|tara:strand:+ start:11988 stop:13889 length:1902 start_codon:yes stop_codon:yes gene_type:complete